MNNKEPGYVYLSQNTPPSVSMPSKNGSENRPLIYVKYLCTKGLHFVNQQYYIITSI